MTIPQEIGIAVLIWIATPYAWLFSSFLYRRHRSKRDAERGGER